MFEVVVHRAVFDFDLVHPERLTECFGSGIECMRELVGVEGELKFLAGTLLRWRLGHFCLFAFAAREQAERQHGARDLLHVSSKKPFWCGNSAGGLRYI